MSYFGTGSAVNHSLFGVIEFSDMAAFTTYHAASLRGFARSRAVLRGVGELIFGGHDCFHYIFLPPFRCYR
jgi:hypothetical protein